MRLIRSHSIAVLALFVALGGTAYSALRVTGKHVVNGSLTGKDVRDGSLRRADLAAGALPARRAVHTRQVGGYTRILARISSVSPTASEVASNEVSCRDGEVATGGGVLNATPSTVYTTVPMEVMESYPIVPAMENGTAAVAWRATVRYHRESSNQELYKPAVYVICASR